MGCEEWVQLESDGQIEDGVQVEGLALVERRIGALRCEVEGVDRGDRTVGAGAGVVVLCAREGVVGEQRGAARDGRVEADVAAVVCRVRGGLLDEKAADAGDGARRREDGSARRCEGDWRKEIFVELPFEAPG